jgi:hypothetical protein
MAQKKKKQGKTLPDIGGVHSLFSSGNEAKGRQELTRGYRKGTKAAETDLRHGLKKGILPAYESAESTLAATGPAGVATLEQGRTADLGYYQPYQQAGQAGSQSYADALGLNGPEGVTRAQQQFQVGPGYQFAMDQGIQGIERTAAARGELGGGGTTLDQIKYSQGLANQEWNNYLGGLQNEQQLGYNTAGQMSGVNKDYLTREVAASTDAATKAAAVRQGIGEAKSAYYSGLANLDYSKYLGIAGARNQYQGSKDQTGANVFTGVTSAAQTASDIFKPTYSPTSLASG